MAQLSQATRRLVPFCSVEDLDMKTTRIVAWQPISLTRLGGVSQLHLPSGRSLELKSGDGL